MSLITRNTTPNIGTEVDRPRDRLLSGAHADDRALLCRLRDELSDVAAQGRNPHA